MPTYEYKCSACGHQFERFQSITADRIRKCPQCGKVKVNRLVSAGGGVIFKGSGFYATDYRSDSYKTAAKAENPAPPPAADTSKAAQAKPNETKAVEAKPAGKDSTTTSTARRSTSKGKA